jgi:Electron transfer flavoprotein, alpha subunit
MNVVVCVKPSADAISPFDECALECALQIENAKVTVIGMGSKSTLNSLKRLTRFPIDRAILLCDDAFAGSDTLATAYVLSLAIKKLSPDLILCGRQSIDGDTAQTGPCLSQMVGASLIATVLQIHDISNEICCTTRTGEEKASLPALITVERINTLRFPSMRAQIREVELWNASEIGADNSKCGLYGSPTRVIKTFPCEIGKRNCQIIPPSALAKTIERERKNNRFVPQPDSPEPCEKMKEIWVVGSELQPIAQTIAKKVIVLEKQAVENIVSQILRQHPNAVLWTADTYGRTNAPKAAALLQTGLCADCTSLSVVGETLFMTRPTYGGNLFAKIECRTAPQMATVRLSEMTTDEIIVSVGKGAANDIPLLQEFAKKIGATLCASRAVVDMGLLPYEMQVGLTGKSVTPKIYLACGISGSIQHTCATVRAKTIIAINPDQNARIFEYADYGIIAEVKEIEEFL